MKIILISGKAEAGKTTTAKFLKKKLDEGLRRGQAIAETQKKFSICHPQTVYNIEKRVLKRKEDGNG